MLQKQWLWNYRIMKTRLADPIDESVWIEPHWIYWLHEVYYNNKWRIKNRTADSVIWYYDSIDELVAEIKLMYKDVMNTKDIVLDCDKTNRYNNNYKQNQLDILDLEEEVLS